MGRFLNEDSVEGQIDNPLSMNLYTYCYNNSLSYIDPTGNTAQDFFMGMGDVLFAGLDNDFVKWFLGKMGLGIPCPQIVVGVIKRKSGRQYLI